MLKLIVVLAVALCLAAHADFQSDFQELHGSGIYTTSDHSKASNRLRSFERDFATGDKSRLAERVNYAMRGLFKVAVTNLRKKGYRDTANEVELGWRGMDGELQRIVASRQIGDFEPWNQKLAILYLLIETKLTYETCHLLRIDDIATFLWTPGVVFDPCRYGKSEFEFHFTKDDPQSPHPYRGLFPTTTYWLTTISCSVATFSMGLVFPVCSPAAFLVEKGAREWLGPKLATFIYDKSCSFEGVN